MDRVQRRQLHPTRLPSLEESALARQKIVWLNAQIFYLRNLLANLEHERDNCRSFIAPIRRLPPELLCQIAEHYDQLGGCVQLLSTVSSSFRCALVGIKRLWRKIILVGSRVIEDEVKEYSVGTNLAFLNLPLMCDRATYAAPLQVI